MTEYDRLIQCLSRFPSKKWLNQYFDLLKRLLTHFEIASDDPRISLSLRTEGGLPVNFGQRYVLEPLRNKRIGIIVTAAFEVKTIPGKIIYEFTTSRVIDARFITIPFPEGKQLSPILYNACLESCGDILNKTKKSGVRKYHSPLLYDFTMERPVRDELLNELTIPDAAGE